MRLPIVRSAMMLAGLLTIAMTAGCGGGPSFKLTPVSGTVKLNGVPLEGASVQYVYMGEAPPEDFTGSVGMTDANGKYELITNGGKGTIAGKFKIIVQKTTDPSGAALKEDLEGGMDIEQLKLAGKAVEWIPPKYSDFTQTELEAEVVEGQPLVKDIEMTK